MRIGDGKLCSSYDFSHSSVTALSVDRNDGCMADKKKIIAMKSIGVVKTKEKNVPRHWSVSDVEGTLVIDRAYLTGLKDIQKGDKIAVIFHFHKSEPFSPDLLIQKPPHRIKKMGVFSTCSPRRPNPIGLSVLEVLDIQENRIQVKGLDLLNDTPILDIKPHIDATSL